jgi:hypothetical protein
MFVNIELANGQHGQGYNFGELLYSKRDFLARCYCDPYDGGWNDGPSEEDWTYGYQDGYNHGNGYDQSCTDQYWNEFSRRNNLARW